MYCFGLANLRSNTNGPALRSTINPKTFKMKTKNLLVIGMALFLVTACQKEEETPSVETAQETELTVKYIAENYYNPDLTEEEKTKVANAYLELDVEEMKAYFQMRAEIMKAEGSDTKDVDAKLELLLEVNDEIFQETGKSYSQADVAKVSARYYEKLVEANLDEKGQEVARNSSCSNWYKTTNWRFYRYQGPATAAQYHAMYFVGFRNFGGNSPDCDMMFRSTRYVESRRTNYLVASTAAAMNAMTGTFLGIYSKNATEVLGREVWYSSSRRSLYAEVGIGADRINVNYPLGGANTFARQIWVTSFAY